MISRFQVYSTQRLFIPPLGVARSIRSIRDQSDAATSAKLHTLSRLLLFLFFSVSFFFLFQRGWRSFHAYTAPLVDPPIAWLTLAGRNSRFVVRKTLWETTVEDRGEGYPLISLIFADKVCKDCLRVLRCFLLDLLKRRYITTFRVG